ncbi:hypothetical protein [Natribacillus halophilus]|uniref:Uncharacterized protein n=1 Tax=Natribacillus halophilus TaxID=549003 RepID=A0A1G8SRQ8_9BACI|nr:hypothetical protein [Natribacillus halophilus]SDJ31844.1 hypothetical protein SAMN04488123_13411 [Natribacillus halophilus]
MRKGEGDEEMASLHEKVKNKSKITDEERKKLIKRASKTIDKKYDKAMRMLSKN